MIPPAPSTTPRCPGRLGNRLPSPLQHVAPLLLLVMLLVAAVSPAWALSVMDLPSVPPASHVLDTADVLSRASRGEIEHRLEALADQRVDGRLITLNRLDYGLSLDELGSQLIDRWQHTPSQDGTSPLPLLLFLIDSQNKASAIVSSAGLDRQLPADVLQSTARTTMNQPLRQGDRYRQASLDAISRLDVVLQGGEDPGPPAEQDEAPAVSNIPSREDTQNSNAFTWVVVLLVVGSVVPMVTWWVFSR